MLVTREPAPANCSSYFHEVAPPAVYRAFLLHQSLAQRGLAAGLTINRATGLPERTREETLENQLHWPLRIINSGCHLTAFKKGPTEWPGKTDTKKTLSGTDREAVLPVRVCECVSTGAAQHASPPVVGFHGTVRVVAVRVGFIISGVCTPGRPACVCASTFVEGLGRGTPKYTHWNAKCVFWVPP